MAFVSDPFAFTGTLDTSSTDSGAVPWTFKGAHDTAYNATAEQDEVGEGEGTSAAATTDDKSVASVCPAFAMTSSDLATAAEGRLVLTQRELNRTY